MLKFDQTHFESVQPNLPPRQQPLQFIHQNYIHVRTIHQRISKRGSNLTNSKNPIAKTTSDLGPLAGNRSCLVESSLTTPRLSCSIVRRQFGQQAIPSVDHPPLPPTLPPYHFWEAAPDEPKYQTMPGHPGTHGVNNTAEFVVPLTYPKSTSPDRFGQGLCPPQAQSSSGASCRLV